MNEKGGSESTKREKKKDTFPDRTLGAESGGLCKKICFTKAIKSSIVGQRRRVKCCLLKALGFSASFSYLYL